MSALRQPATRGKAATTRLRKVSCEECGYTVRMARSWIAVALPSCPNPDCGAYGAPMACADPADAIELGLLDKTDLPRKAWTEICRANGWEDEIIRTSPGPRRAPKRCEHPGCGAFRGAGERYCANHAKQDMPF